jgi:hypothetical protein
MNRVRRILGDPIVHFALAGAVLYGAYVSVSDRGPERGEETIVVDRRALLTFMQYRANAFEPDTFNAVLDSMTAAEIDATVDEYVNEEILYREAQSLGLDASDYIIRQRMVQKMSFLIADLADRGPDGSDAELQAYFDEHRDAYATQPWTTFTHVFFDAERRNDGGALEAANDLLAKLNSSAAGFNDASAFGDRFPFLRNYVERTYEYVASHFGSEFAEKLSRLPASDSRWQGPIGSVLGQHIVLITKQAPRALPSLEEVRGEVERDFHEELSRKAVAEMTRAMRERYRIEIRDVREPRP